MPSRKREKAACSHSLHLGSSPHAAEVGYKQPLRAQLLAATLPSGRIPKAFETGHSDDSLRCAPPPGTFSAPLVLPGDDLAYDPKYPAQSLRSFIHEKHRNEITRKRGTIYVIPPPAVANEVEFADSWIHPSEKAPSNPATLVEVEDIVSYLTAFFHPIPVKLFTEGLTFTTWSDDSELQSKGKSESKSNASQNLPQYIGLATTTSCTRIRCRPCPPSSPSSISSSRSEVNRLFPAQLQLSDLLDTLIGLLPSSAYAVILLTHHDLYESDTDDFVCGRAYGGSRVAVVSSTRYQPCLDTVQGIDSAHAWPASHCARHMAKLCGTNLKNLAKSEEIPASAPIFRAMDAYLSRPRIPSSSVKPRQLKPPQHSASYIRHLHRVCRTAAHELGHCLCLAHCVYYACLMQGTAGLDEDARQPPVMCAVCETKIGWAIDSAREKGAMGAALSRSGSGRGWRREREVKLVEVCEGWVGAAAEAAAKGNVGGSGRGNRDRGGDGDGDGDGGEGWRAMAAWLRARWEAETDVEAEAEFGGGEEGRSWADAGSGAGEVERKPKRKRGGITRPKGRSAGDGQDDNGVEVIDLTT